MVPPLPRLHPSRDSTPSHDSTPSQTTLAPTVLSRPPPLLHLPMYRYGTITRSTQFRMYVLISVPTHTHTHNTHTLTSPYPHTHTHPHIPHPHTHTLTSPHPLTHTHSHPHIPTPSHPHTLTHTHTPSHPHTLTHTQTHTLTSPHPHTHTPSYSHTLTSHTLIPAVQPFSFPHTRRQSPDRENRKTGDQGGRSALFGDSLIPILFLVSAPCRLCSVAFFTQRGGDLRLC